MHFFRTLAVPLVLLCGVLAWPGGASATITCSLDAGGTLSVFTDEMTAIIRSGDAIVVTGTGCSGSPTVSNTDAVVVTDGSSLDDGEQISIDQSLGGAFAPGQSSEGVGIDEIEFDLTALDVSGGGAILIAGTGGDDVITLGTLGVSLNADGDVDVLLPAVTGPLRFFGVGGDDVIAATGGFGSGGPSSNRSLYLSGGPGDDILDATDGDLGPGSDQVQGDAGDDQLIGDPSADAVLYLFSPAGVVVHLDTSPRTAIGEGSDTITGIDNVFGSDQDDVLFGTALSNVLFGFGGADEIHGGDSQDVIDGGGGDDVLHGEGGEDVITGGEGDDVLTEIFGNGFQPQLSGGPGADLFRIAFGSASGTIAIDGGDGSDEIQVTCTPGKVTDTPAGPGGGTLARGGETVVYSSAEAVSIPPQCQSDPPPATPLPGPSGPQPGPPAGGTGAAPAQPSGSPAPPSQQPVAIVPALGAIIVTGARTGGTVRLDAGRSFLVAGGVAVDPAAWRWRVRVPGRGLAAPDLSAIVLRTTRFVRAWVDVHGATGALGSAGIRLPARVVGLLTVRMPAATAASRELRAAVVRRAAPVARRRERAVLPRALAAGQRVLSIVTAPGRPLAVRVRVMRNASNRWLRRLERLSPERLQRAVGRPIALAPGARLLIVRSAAGSRLSLTFVRPRGR